jgi:hypothetical protein
MRTSYFILFLGAAFLYAQNGQAVTASTQGHKLTNEQKQWVQSNRPVKWVSL